MKNVYFTRTLLGLFLLTSLLFTACSSDSKSKPDGALHDGALHDGALHDKTSVGDQRLAAEHTTNPDLSTPDLSSADLPSMGDIGVSYTGSFPANPSPGFTDVNLTVEGVMRDVTIYAPNGWQKNKPLIIACPSTDTDSEDGIWDVAANELADQEKMIVVSVEPAKKSKGDWDQHVAGEAYFDTYPSEDFATNNDLKFVVAAIAEAYRVYAIDLKRVFTTGYSNGAFFAQFAAFHLPNRITGFAAAGGGLVKCADTFDCNFNGAAATTPTCAALAKLPKWCHNCTGPDKPGIIPTTGRKPASYFFHAANDDVVSVYYDCQLQDRLKSLTYPMKFDLRLKGGHNAPPHFMVDAWKWLSKYKLP